jgi:hypothetical protein
VCLIIVCVCVCVQGMYSSLCVCVCTGDVLIIVCVCVYRGGGESWTPGQDVYTDQYSVRGGAQFERGGRRGGGG